MPSRLNSDGSLPNSDWVQLNPATQATSTPVKLNATVIKAQRCILRADSNNVGNISIGPNSSANWATLSKGTEYEISAQSDNTFDISKWFMSIATNGDVLHVLYQA